MVMKSSRLGVGASAASLVAVSVMLCGCVLGLSRPASGRSDVTKDAAQQATAADKAVATSTTAESPVVVDGIGSTPSLSVGAAPTTAPSAPTVTLRKGVVRPSAPLVVRPAPPVRPAVPAAPSASHRVESATVVLSDAELTALKQAAESAASQLQQSSAVLEKARGAFEAAKDLTSSPEFKQKLLEAENAYKLAEQNMKAAEAQLRARMDFSDAIKRSEQRAKELRGKVEQYRERVGQAPPLKVEQYKFSSDFQSKQTSQYRVGELKVMNLPLETVFETLRAETGANLVIDWKSLTAAGVEENTSITVELRNVPLNDAITVIGRLATGSDDVVTVDIKGDVIVVASDIKARAKRPVMVMDIADLVEGGPDRDANACKVCQLITSSVAPDSWTEQGGANSIQYFNGKLVIAADTQTVDEVRLLLDMLRAK